MAAGDGPGSEVPEQRGSSSQVPCAPGSAKASSGHQPPGWLEAPSSASPLAAGPAVLPWALPPLPLAGKPLLCLEGIFLLSPLPAA